MVVDCESGRMSLGLAMGLATTPAQGASWASNTAIALHGGSDALGEAGDTLREVLTNGGSIEEARSAANKVAVVITAIKSATGSARKTAVTLEPL